jgi:hypothetical protein
LRQAVMQEFSEVVRETALAVDGRQVDIVVV